MNLSSLKLNTIVKYFSEYRKFYLIYIFLVLIFSFSLLSEKNLEHPMMEIIFIFFISILGIFCLTFYFNNKNDNDLYKTVFIFLIIFGLVCTFITPICEGPDFREHSVRSEITSRGVLFPEYNGINLTSYYQNNESEYVWDGTGFETIASSSSFFYDRIHKTVFDTTHDTDKINHTPINLHSCFVQNSFLGYLPQGLGMFIAKLLDMNQIWLLWLGSICNLIVYSSIITFAVKKSPIFKIPIFVTACIPLSLFLGASISIDSMIISLSLLAIAYFFYMYKLEEKTLTIKDILIFSIICLCLGLCKITMFAFIFLVFAVPRKNFENRNVLIFSLIMMFILAIIALMQGTSGNDALWHSYRARIFFKNHVNSTQQLSFLLSEHNLILELSNFLANLKEAIIPLIPTYHEFNNTPNGFLSPLTLLFVGFIFLGYPTNEKISNKSKIIVLLILMAIFIGTDFIVYLTWNPVGQLNTQGIQSRYFLPLFALCPFIFSINNNKEDDKIRNYTVLITLSLLAAFLLEIIFKFY